MLTFKRVNMNGYNSRSSFFWNDEELEETPYSAAVVWPNGIAEVLPFRIATDYVGYNDYPIQQAYLEIVYNGNRTSIELCSDEEYSFVKHLTDVGYNPIPMHNETKEVEAPYGDTKSYVHL